MVDPYIYYSSFSAEYKAVLNKAIELGFLLPSVGQQVAQNLLMQQLISSGVFGAMDLIYIMQNDCGIDFARINWKNPSAFFMAFPTSEHPMWHKNLGMSGRPDITSAPFYADTGFIPATDGVNWTQNLAGAFISHISGYTGFGYNIFTESGTTNINRLHQYHFDGQGGYAANSASVNFNLTSPQFIGMTGTERTASTAMRYTHNGTGINSSVFGSAALSTTSVKLFNNNIASPYPASYTSSNAPIQAVLAGSALAGAIQVVLYNALLQYQNTFFTVGTLTTVGAGNYTVPDGVTQIKVECWGAGGAGRGFANAGQTRTGAGGAGAAYASSILTVTPGAIIPYSIGVGGSGTTGNGTAGGDTSWNSGQILAKGGSGSVSVDGTFAQGGQASACIGDVKYSGGNGGSQGPTLASSSASGGGAAGALGAGFPGVNGTAGVTFASRPACQLLGPGSPGVSWSNTTNSTGALGSFGSGGGGARRTTSSRIGGAGGNGYIRITYYKQY